MEQEIFSIQVNENGIAWLQKTKRVASLLFGIAVVTSVVDIVYFFLKFYDPNINPANISEPLFKYEIYVSMAYLFCWTVMFPVQTFLYWKFLKQNVTGIEEQNSDKFNDSFRLLLLNSKMAVASFLI